MGAFTAAVAIPVSESYDADKLDAAVSEAMAPYGPSGTRHWDWYAIGIEWAGVYAYIDTIGGWNEESETWLPYDKWIASIKGSGYVVVHVRCKG